MIFLLVPVPAAIWLLLLAWALLRLTARAVAGILRLLVTVLVGTITLTARLVRHRRTPVGP